MSTDNYLNTMQVLLEERKELQKKLAEVEKQISALQGVLQKRPQGRPRGAVLPNSMDSLILKSLDEHINGLSFSGLVCNLLQKGYQTTASSEDFKKMVKSRISCLKRKEQIWQDRVSLIFYKTQN
jgi:hypothetical protein